MSSKTKSTQQTTQQNDPWAPAIPYLTEGLSNASGIFKKYQNLTPGQTAALDQGKQVANDRMGSGMFGKISDAAGKLLGGDMSPAVTPVKGAAYDAAASRSALGATDPTSAIAKTLSGQVDNPQLAAMADAATRGGQRQYADAVSDSADSLTRTVMPSIRAGAQMSGGYGGTRQGIAEGLAMAEREKTLGRGARDLGIAANDATANLYGNAYESAQNRMASMADSEANRAQQAGMFNVSTGLDTQFRNNDQEMQRAQIRAAQLGQGAGIFGQGAGMEDDTINSLLGLEGYPAQWENDLLAPYMGAITGVGGMGGTSNGTMTGTQKTSNPFGAITNAAMAAAMFSDARLKTNVETVGYDAAGRRWVEYAYVWEPGERVRGVIAQEVRKTDPSAVVVGPGGFLMVDYTQLEAA